MSDSTSGSAASSSPAKAGRKRAKSPKTREHKGPFGRIALFVRQIVAELKKVVRPTRKELVTYTCVVLVFVVLVMAFVTALDFGFGKLATWIFKG